MSERPSSVAAVLLAAGRGERFGSNKLLFDLDGRPLVTHALSAVLASCLTKIYIVVDGTDPSVERVVDSFAREHDGPVVSSRDADGGPGPQTAAKRIQMVRNPEPSRGMMSSVKLGLKAIDPSYQAAMVVLADMPYVSLATV
ncbi:MAG: NTP transferase domain-containing protein, partial [bacterium]